MRPQTEPQYYDNTLKALFGDEAAQILPQLLSETELAGEQNIEIDRSKLKADLVYNVKHKGLPHILNMELQTDADSAMHIRLLQYHVGLLAKHGLPVISMVMYPFETSVPTSPFEEKSGDEVLLTFHLKILCLWKLEAWYFVSKHAVCMYTLLPAMKDANASLLIRAIREMDQHYPKEELRHHLIRFRSIMQRSKMSKSDKQTVTEALDMQYGRDWFIETSPEFIEFAEKGKAQARAEGEIQGLQQIVQDTVQDRFPSLAQFAQQQITLVCEPATLRKLVLEIMHAPDEATVRRLFSEKGPEHEPQNH